MSVEHLQPLGAAAVQPTFVGWLLQWLWAFEIRSWDFAGCSQGNHSKQGWGPSSLSVHPSVCPSVRPSLVPVSKEIEMKANFFPSPPCERGREEEEEREKKISPPRGSAVIKSFSFEKQPEKRSVSNPAREERRNIPPLRAAPGMEGPCGDAKFGLIPLQDAFLGWMRIGSEEL